jgi:uncharacterized protein (TIGR02996 family)
MAKASRNLEKQGKTVVVEWDETTVVTIAGGKRAEQSHPSARDAAKAFVATVQSKLKAGFTPQKTPVRPLVEAIKAHVFWNEVLKAFSAEEIPEVLAVAMRDPRIHVDLLRSVVTEELIAFFLKAAEEYQGYQQEDLFKALAFAAKKDEPKALIQKTLGELAPAIPQASLKKSAERFLKRLGAPPKATPAVPEKPKPGSSEEGLLAAIAADPASDEPRLVYADWLLEKGLGWGEYIQLSCKAAKLTRFSPEEQELSAQLAKLERKHAKDFLAPVRPFLRSWSFERGLLARLETDAQLFMQAADAVADRAPRATLILVGLKTKNAPGLADTPLGRFERVILDSNRIDDAGAVALAGSPRLSGLEHLNLRYNLFGDEGIRAFATSPNVATLRSLTMVGFSSSKGGAASVETLRLLLACDGLPHLEELSLTCSGTGIGRALAACQLPLKSIDLVAADFGDADVDDLEAAWNRKARFRVTVQSTRLTDSGRTALDRLSAPAE